MIVVAGEALMDVLAGDAGTLEALPGGAPFNVARAVARLGGECGYAGRLSEDPFGERLRDSLLAAGVTLLAPEPAPAPTTLAVATLDHAGSAQYRFYLDGTSAASLSPADLPTGLLGRADALVVGGLALVLSPISRTLTVLVRDAPDTLLVVVDPNCRPRAIADPHAYRRALAAVLERADVVKVSEEDLAFLAPDAKPETAARDLLAQGPGAVILTTGSSPAVVHTATGTAQVPVPSVEVVDTVGAGDAFVAALVTWLVAHGAGRTGARQLDVLTAATGAAAEVASAACTTRGANLPPETRALVSA